MYLYISFVCVCLCVLEYVCVYSTKKIHQSCLYPLPLSPMLQVITSCKWPPKKILVTLRRCHVLQLPLHNADSFSIGRIHVPGGCRWGEGGGVRGRWTPGRYFKVVSIQSCRGYLGTMCHHGMTMTNWSLSGDTASAKAWLYYLAAKLITQLIIYKQSNYIEIRDLF